MTENQIMEIPHPGYFLIEELEAREWTQRDLAYILGVPEQAITMIVTGKRGISPDMAKALGDAFDVNPEFFANLQKAYDMSKAREPDPSVARRAKLQNVYPVREMIKRGWLEDTDAQLLEGQMARFFEVANSNEIPHMQHAAKKTSYDEAPSSQLAWLFRVKQIAQSMGAAKYSEKSLREAIPNIQRLMSEPEEIRHVPLMLAKCGVRFVVVECLPNSKIDGVCFWLNAQSPVIGLSIRFDRIDNFWFVLWHEIEHVLRRHGVESAIIDADLEGERAGEGSDVPEQERIANTAALNYCVPKDELSSFVARKSPFFSEQDIVGFARRLQIHPGLVVGQIQARTKRWDFLRKHLVKVRQFILPGAMVDGWGQVAEVYL